MKPSEVAKLLGITPDRIKYFKKKGVFTPQRPPAKGKPTDYTKHDVTELKKLVILSKLSLTCGDIKKLQNGSWTLERALIARRAATERKLHRMTRSMELVDSIIKDNVQFDTFDSDYYWNMIVQREKEAYFLTDARSAREETL